ncbi:hypothetical protein [Sinisalibacter lacisalsi]|uniref:hypothetical protein n=1 Tax=Sinisalibacter lacisalsi TaxID=1526570 RepID=UPI001668EC28|nr:hypothetical protein [Sinisalibacter lacisalsi]
MLQMGCNAHNHPTDCSCGFGGDTGNTPGASNYWSLGDVALPQTDLRQVTFQTTCPLCGGACYYYENEFGSKVWFDELGIPWTKHPCFENEPELRLERPNNAAEALGPYELEPQRVFAKLLWKKGNWRFFAVLKDHQSTYLQHSWGPRRRVNFGDEEYSRTIGYFCTRHRIPNGCFIIISWGQRKFFFIPDDASDGFEIFPSIWKEEVFDRVGSLRIQRATSCFRDVLESFGKVSDPQDRAFLAELLYDQTDLPIETIAFLSHVPLIDAIRISNGEGKQPHVKNRSKIREVALKIGSILYDVDL